MVMFPLLLAKVFAEAIKEVELRAFSRGLHDLVRASRNRKMQQGLLYLDTKGLVATLKTYSHMNLLLTENNVFYTLIN